MEVNFEQSVYMELEASFGTHRHVRILECLQSATMEVSLQALYTSVNGLQTRYILCNPEFSKTEDELLFVARVIISGCCFHLLQVMLQIRYVEIYYHQIVSRKLVAEQISAESV